LKAYLNKHGAPHCMKLHKIMDENRESMHETVLKILNHHDVSSGIVNEFEAACSSEKEQSFQEAVADYKAKFEKVNRRQTTK